jgi:hypothetical protein
MGNLADVPSAADPYGVRVLASALASCPGGQRLSRRHHGERLEVDKATLSASFFEPKSE